MTFVSVASHSDGASIVEVKVAQFFHPVRVCQPSVHLDEGLASFQTQQSPGLRFRQKFAHRTLGEFKDRLSEEFLTEVALLEKLLDSSRNGLQARL